MIEQCIRVDGRLVRLVPRNCFPDVEAAQCKQIPVVGRSGFYDEVPQSDFKLADVTHLWEARFK